MALNILTGHDEEIETPTDSLGTSDTSQQVQNLLRIGGYDTLVQIKEDGVFLDVSSLTRQRFMGYVDSIFKSNYYFEGLDYTLFSQLVFNPSDVKSKGDSSNYQVKLCDKISLFPPERASKYHKPMIFGRNKDQAEYTFSPLFDEVVDENGKTKEVNIFLNVDEFIAKMWLHGIRYGLQISLIQEAISGAKEKKVVIAEALEPIPGVDAYLETIIPLGQDLQIQTTNGKLDWKNYARVFPQVPAGKKMYQKIPLKEGKIGMNIAGDQLLPTDPIDFDMYKWCGEGTSVIQENDIQYLVSSQPGYVQPIIGHYDSKSHGEKEGKKVKVDIDQMKSPVAVTRDIQLGTIGPKTGNIHASGDVSIHGEVVHDYWVKAENVKCIGDVSGSICAKNDIKITGNTIGGSSVQTSFQSNKIGENGYISSQQGNIFIQGRVLSSSLLSAQIGTVSAPTVESSVIIGDKIILQDVRSSVIIGKNIQIDNGVNSIIICFGTLSIKTLISVKGSGNIILIIKPKNLKETIENISSKITKLRQNTQEILQVIQQLEHRNKEIQNDPQALEIIGLRKKKELTLSEKDMISQNIERFNKKLRELQTNNTHLTLLSQKIKLQAEELEKLSITFEQFSKSQEKIVSPEVHIGFNQSQTKLAYLLVENFEDFSQLPQETLMLLANYRDMIQNKTFSIEMIQEIGEGSNMTWKYQG